MAEGLSPISFAELVAAVSAGTQESAENVTLGRLLEGQKLQVETPFVYPGRQGKVMLELAMVSQDRVRISDGGLLLRCLAEQGMDVQGDMILSRTVFHAAKQFPGAGVYRGQLCLDCQPDSLAAGLWSFLQMLVELIGLRHCKYKDALVQFEKRRDADAHGPGWRPS
ncbi:MAG: hypothetical protein N3B14_09635 [Thermoleophilia bacterium]|nr:hypothetical protein [Thermoleophilia bacterium]